MFELGTQTQNVVRDDHPEEGFSMLKRSGFSCCDFSLHGYLKNTDIYWSEINSFFSKSTDELMDHFSPMKDAALTTGIRIHQMHMPYPLYVPGAESDVNDHMRQEVMPKSMELCAFLGCRYIVVHGLKLVRYLGSEEEEWRETERYLHEIIPFAAGHGITICVENLYDVMGGHIVEGPCCSAEKAAQRIDRINSQYGEEVLGFCYDVGHANLIGLKHERFLEVLGKRLKVLHIHDNDGIRDLHQLPFTFSRTRESSSSTDWKAFFRGLGKSDFNGVLSFETAPALQTFPPELKEDVLRLIARTGAYMSDKISATRSG